MATCFVDSTTLLYPLDLDDPLKRNLSAAWLKALRDQDQLTMSPQVLNEAYWVVLRRDRFASARSVIRDYLRDYGRWALQVMTYETVLEAWRLRDRYGVVLWDALLLASANAAGCPYFLSEDLNDGQLYGTVHALNPFRHAPSDVLGAAQL
jgi:predicted nucleic acid-binding protein